MTQVTLIPEVRSYHPRLLAVTPRSRDFVFPAVCGRGIPSFPNATQSFRVRAKRLATVWGLACLVVATACSVSERTGLRLAGATMPDAGPNVCNAQNACDTDDAGPAGSQPNQTDCHDGECWWSHERDACRSAGVPTKADRPKQSEASEIPDIYLGMSRMRIGETDEAGAPSRDAWQSFGLDLDGVCTSSPSCSSTQRACRPAGPETPFDGQLCRDNMFARLTPVAAAVPEIGRRFGAQAQPHQADHLAAARDERRRSGA